MRCALIRNGVVENVVIIEDDGDWQVPDGFQSVATEIGNIGDSYNGTTFTPLESPPAPTPVPEILSRWQFLAVAALSGIITQEAAQAALAGTMAPPFVDFLATLPPDRQFPAAMLLGGAQEFHRHHPLVQEFLTAKGMTEAEADAIWVQGAALMQA